MGVKDAQAQRAGRGHRREDARALRGGVEVRPRPTVQTPALYVPMLMAMRVVLSGPTEVSVAVTKPPVATSNVNVMAPLVLMDPVKVWVTGGVGVGVGIVGFELLLHAAEVPRSAVANNTGRTDRRRMGLLNWSRVTRPE